MQERTAAVIVIGNEILSGKSEDKNASYLIGELHGLGVSLRRIVVVPDDVDDIAAAVRECASRFDHIFTSGGVGPTHDDVTIQGVARAFDREVVRDPVLASMLMGYFGKEANEARMRLADIPEGSELVLDSGMRWPVLAIENVFILPGVPELFRSKFEAIRERFRAHPYHVRAIYTREDEFDIAARLDSVAASHPGVEIGSYPSFSQDEFRVKITIQSKEAGAVDAAVAELVHLLNPGDLVRTE